MRAPAADVPLKPEAEHVFRLYVSSASPISARAIVNTRRFLDKHLPGRHRLTILEIGNHVDLARADQIVASPTLARIQPQPTRRFIGDMSDHRRVIAALGLPSSLEHQ